MIKIRHSEKVIFDERPGDGKEVGSLAARGKSIPGSRNRKYKGPEVSAHVACSRTRWVLGLEEVNAGMCNSR